MNCNISIIVSSKAKSIKRVINILGIIAVIPLIIFYVWTGYGNCLLWVLLFFSIFVIIPIQVIYIADNVIFEKHTFQARLQIFDNPSYKYSEFQKVYFDKNKEIILITANDRKLFSFTLNLFNKNEMLNILKEFQKRGKEVIVHDIWSNIYMLENEHIAEKSKISNKIPIYMYATFMLILSYIPVYINIHPKTEKQYYANGTLQFEIPFKYGQENGVLKEYYESGKIGSLSEWKHGKRNGLTTVYYENGKVKRESFYENGKKEGTERLYDENEILYAEIEYKKGYPNGTMKLYDKKKLSAMGQLIDGKGILDRYDEEGNKIGHMDFVFPKQEKLENSL